jgi:predicted dehydrogenase
MPIRVGIVGLSTDEEAWATSIHVNFIKANPNMYTLVALATSSPESAAASGKVHGLPAEKCYSSSKALAEDPDVDLVVIAVKVRVAINTIFPCNVDLAY